MIIRNKKTNQYVAGMQLLPGKKLSLLWTDDPRQAEHMTPSQNDWEKGFESFQKNMNLELEIVED